MSQNVNETGLQGQTKQLLDGPLKHIRVAALAAVLVPLASVFAAPASAQDCFSGGCKVAGTVFTDTNQNGFQDAGRTSVIEGVKVTICLLCNGTDNFDTDRSGRAYSIFVGVPGTYSVVSQYQQACRRRPRRRRQRAGSRRPWLQHDRHLSHRQASFFTATSNPGPDAGILENHPDAWPVHLTVGIVTVSASLTRRRRPSRGSARSARTNDDDIQLARAGDIERPDRQRHQLRE